MTPEPDLNKIVVNSVNEALAKKIKEAKLNKKMVNADNLQLIEKIKALASEMQKTKIDNQLFFDLDTVDAVIEPTPDISKQVGSKITYVIRDISAPTTIEAGNPSGLHLEAIAPGTCLIAYDRNHKEQYIVNLYYNKMVDSHTSNKIRSVNDKNFNVVANSIHRSYINLMAGNQVSPDLSLIGHIYDDHKSLHLYTVPMAILFELEVESNPYPVCKYYTYFHDNIVSTEYEYANKTHIYSCSNKEVRKKNGVFTKDRPCACIYNDSSSSQLSCAMYEPSSMFELSASSSNPVPNPIVTKVELRSFIDRSSKKKIYTVNCDGSESFKFSCDDDSVKQIFDEIVKDLSVSGQSFVYENEDHSPISTKKKIVPFLKTLFGLEKQND